LFARLRETSSLRRLTRKLAVALRISHYLPAVWSTHPQQADVLTDRLCEVLNLIEEFEQIKREFVTTGSVEILIN
jgi:hypothetical protein